jgi:hypothetical protein
LELTGSAVGSGGATLAVQGSVDLARGDLEASARARGFDLVSMTGYSERFLGYELDSGAADIDLNYVLAGSELDGKNHVAIQDFTLGQAVDSEQAIKVPLKLAIALLQGPAGGIDLNVPVSGNLDDPEFSLGGIVVKAFFNLIIKAAASPFLVLGALLPDGGDALDQIDFAPGKATIDLSSMDSIGKLGVVLEKRPALVLRVRGMADPLKDRRALRRQHLEIRINEYSQANAVDRAQALRSLAGEAGLTVDDSSTDDGLMSGLLESVDVSDADLLALARSRSQAVTDALIATHPTLADRLLDQDVLIRESAGERVDFEVGVDVR